MVIRILWHTWSSLTTKLRLGTLPKNPCTMVGAADANGNADADADSCADADADADADTSSSDMMVSLVAPAPRTDP